MSNILCIHPRSFENEYDAIPVSDSEIEEAKAWCDDRGLDYSICTLIEHYDYLACMSEARERVYVTRYQDLAEYVGRHSADCAA